MKRYSNCFSGKSKKKTIKVWGFIHTDHQMWAGSVTDNESIARHAEDLARSILAAYNYNLLMTAQAENSGENS